MFRVVNLNVGAPPQAVMDWLVAGACGPATLVFRLTPTQWSYRTSAQLVVEDILGGSYKVIGCQLPHRLDFTRNDWFGIGGMFLCSEADGGGSRVTLYVSSHSSRRIRSPARVQSLAMDRIAARAPALAAVVKHPSWPGHGVPDEQQWPHG